MEPTIDVVTVAQWVVVVVLAGLSGVAVLRATRGSRAGWWAAVAFGSLALALVAVWLPDWIGWALPARVEGTLMAAVLVFPYLLLRFTATFRPLPRVLEWGAAGAGVVAVAVLAGGAPNVWAVVAVLTYWMGVSAVIVVRLWRAGRDQPGVARHRMRWMAVATAVLALALLTAVELDDAPLAELATHGLLLVSAVGFGLGYVPPRPLRLSWRRHEEAQAMQATASLLRATTIEEVERQLLPATAAILGASGLVVIDATGAVIARQGQSPPLGEHVEIVPGDRHVATAPLGEGQGRLVAWTSPYSPFFGPEERNLFQGMAGVAGLALERCALLAEERQQRSVVDRARTEADAANLAKSEFLSRMSHELRTPLNAVLGFGQLLELAELDDEDQDAVAHILKAGRHLLALIDDVLDLSRIEAGTLTVSLEPVHTGELLRDSIALIEPMATPRGVRVHLDELECDSYVHTDRQRCRQILLNLLSNAVKYNHDHGTVYIVCTRPNDATLRIAVRDTGPGIDPSRQHRLFEAFDRLDAETSSVQGTGLGLALTRQLAERLGGTVGVDSAAGHGATFWLDLPTAVAPANVDEQPPVPVEAPTEGNHQILLVEDNLANLGVVEAILRRRRPGVTVLPAMQGTVALDLAYQHRPTVVLLDLHLPDMPGRDVLARLKADTRTRNIPVVIASADATPGRIRQLLDDGAFDYLTKPLDLTRFLETIDAAIAARTLQ